MTKEETFFLNTDGAQVTNARVILGNQTFAMSGITSVEVKREEHNPSWLMALLLLLVGLASMPSSMLGGGLIAGCGVLLIVNEFRVKPKYRLVFRTAGGEVSALISENATEVETIAKAITDAMVFRG